MRITINLTPDEIREAVLEWVETNATYLSEIDRKECTVTFIDSGGVPFEITARIEAKQVIDLT